VAAAGIRRFTADDVQSWSQAEGRRILLADVVDAGNSDSMSVGFARYAPGESNEWVVTYDEALIVTRGAFSVSSADGRKTTAAAGELIFLDKGTSVTYSAEDSGADVVYVTYPHWIDAQQRSEHAGLLDTFHPAGEPPAKDAVALLRDIYDPLERGESESFQPFFDALADDVVFKTPVGELRGKQAVVDYFVGAGETMEFRPFDAPLEYFRDGDRVVIVGDETFRVKRTGATHHADWAWIYDVRDGLITRIKAIEDLSGVADAIREVIAKAESGQMRAV
jgi:ethanolamine utilization protein EutQ